MTYRYKGERDHFVRAILALLAENGPMTRAEICLALGLNKEKSGSIISRMAKAQPTMPKRVYVVDYVYNDDSNGRFYPRARYDLGDKKDAKKPKSDHRVNVQRYRQRQKTKVASVFDLGLTRREREARNRAIRTGCADRRGSLQEAENPTDGIQHGERAGCVPAHSD